MLMTLRVVKVGTSLLRGFYGRDTSEIIEGYAAALSASFERGDKVVLVTSGAVGLGCSCLGIDSRPEAMVELQAAAAVGQGQLMSLYETAMRRHRHTVAQILLTRADLTNRLRYKNASNTITQLLNWDVLPIINENDSISSSELRFGDNDTLSALVAAAINADDLILLTDVDHLYSTDPRTDKAAQPITDVRDSRDLDVFDSPICADGDRRKWGTGGMVTKLEAARIATASGITVHLADGRNSAGLDALLRGTRGGTVFHPNPHPIGNRKSWLAYVLQPQGILYIDKGACQALQERGASLLLVGIRDVYGNFEANQAVILEDPDGQEVARGLCSLASSTLRQALGSRSGVSRCSPIIIHRNALVLTKSADVRLPNL
ncbi:glutamate 5-kinase [cyanobiont of Ornithocercus magnificus]|nr:glutamate 5-kinase [cyanobiont of Ornithocercus magnificus]